MSPSQKDGKTRLPGWARTPIKEFIDHTRLLEELLRLSKLGIATLTAIPSTVGAIQEALGVTEDPDLEEMKQDAKLAQNEVDNDFPLLHAQFTIQLWGSLEALVLTFLRAWLSEVPDAKTRDQIRNLRIRVGEYESLGSDERNMYILDLLEDSVGSRKRPGIGRFETLLDTFGLSAAVDETTRRDLLKLYYVRNVLVHKRGLADHRFIDGCPWLGMTLGQPVIINHSCWERYYVATLRYAKELAERVRVHFGSPINDPMADQEAG